MKGSKRAPVVTDSLSLVLLAVLGTYPSTASALDQQPRDNRSAQQCLLDNNSYGTESTPTEYAEMIELELGVPPVVDCGATVELPIYVQGVRTIGNPGLHGCDNPSLQVGDCMSGSGLQRYEGRAADGTPLPHVVWISFCRHDGRDTDEYDVPDSVQLIGYNTLTGATAFFESGDNRKWTFVEASTNRLMGLLPGIDDPDAFKTALYLSTLLPQIDRLHLTVDRARYPRGKRVAQHQESRSAPLGAEVGGGHRRESDRGRHRVAERAPRFRSKARRACWARKRGGGNPGLRGCTARSRPPLCRRDPRVRRAWTA